MTMSQAEKTALTNANDLRIALLRSQAAARAYRLGIRDLLPTLSLAVNDSRSILMDAPDTAAKSWSLTVGQPVFDGGRLMRQRALSALQIALDQRSYADQQDALLDTVHQLFNQVLVQKEKLAIQRGVRATMEQQVAIAHTERGIGSILEVDLLDAELELGSVELEIRAAETLLEDYEYRLKRSLGMKPADSLELAGEIDHAYQGIPLPGDTAYFFGVAAENNTGLKKQDLEIRRAQEALRNADSWYLPDVAMELSLSLSGERYPLQSPGLSGKLTFSFPIRPFPISSSVSVGGTPGKVLDTGSSGSIAVLQDMGYWTDRSIGLLGYEASRLKRSDMTQDLEFDISKAISGYEQAKRALELKRKNIELQEKKVFIMSRQLALGGIKRIDYLQAETRLARDRSSLVEQVLQLMQSERSFERLIGARAGELARLAREYTERGGR